MESHLEILIFKLDQLEETRKSFQALEIRDYPSSSSKPNLYELVGKDRAFLSNEHTKKIQRIEAKLSYEIIASKRRTQTRI